MTAASSDPPYTLEALKQSIAGRFESLPARLQVAARYLVDHPNASAVETIKTLSDAAEVQPSVLVRLAKSFGYSGFSEMQAVFRTALLAQTQSYGERMRAQRAGRRAASPQTPEAMLHQLCDGSIESLQGLRDAIDPATLKRAIDLLASARTINVLGLRRSWPIATYFAYLLSRSQRFVRLLGGMGGMLTDEVRVLGSDDVLVAISFHPFHAEAVAAIQQARAQGTPVLALTDSGLSTIAQQASVALEVHDADIGGFRTVAASMALCHGLTVGLLSEDEARMNAKPKAGGARQTRSGSRS